MRSIGRTIGLVWLVSGLVLTAWEAIAGSIGDFLEALIRAGRKAERLPSEGRVFRHLDDIPTKRLPKLDEAESLRRLERLEHVDDSIRREFRELSVGQRSRALEMGTAAQLVLRRYDDGIDVLRKLDGDGIVLLQTYGDFVADGVKLAGPEYKLVVRKTGTGARRFLNDYLRPNYKKLAAAGLATVYLTSPEKFHDGAGNLTAWAAEQFASLGIDVASAVPRGIWQSWRRGSRATRSSPHLEWA